MIYIDKQHIYDSSARPAERHNEKCVNCSKAWIYHYGWKCSKHNTTWFELFDQDNQYLTQSMRELTLPLPYNKEEIKVTIVKKEFDISEWQAWAHNQPGDCPCGIKKDMCDYHAS